MLKITVFLLAALPALTSAGEADIIDARLIPLGGDRYRVEATVRHDDTGWKHYADAFELLDENGKSLGTRVLYHPHVNEQPFTRSHTLSIPPGVARVRVRAHDSVHGHGGKVLEIAVPR